MKARPNTAYSVAVTSADQQMQEVLSALAYFDLFNYPITLQEVHAYMLSETCMEDVIGAVEQLQAQKRVYRFGDFICLHNQPGLEHQRNLKNSLAFKRMITARRVARLLSFFPFVRALAISGSLSKDCADAKSDIDFFIITAPDRLWICRTLMHLIKKLSFLVGQQHCFCMNYYIDEQEMRIREQNIYTAIEILTLIPVFGANTHKRFLQENNWTKQVFPNATPRRFTAPSTQRNGPIKKLLEKLLSHDVFDRLEKRLMHTTISRWSEKTAKEKLNMRGIVMSMDAGTHYAKPDPASFQQKLLLNYQQKIAGVLSPVSSNFVEQPRLTVVRD